MAEARGVWVGKGAKQRLIWIIDGEFVSEQELRRWTYWRTGQHAPPCVVKWQVDLYANRFRETENER